MTLDIFFLELKKAVSQEKIPHKYAEILKHFYEGYRSTLGEKFSLSEEKLFVTYLELASSQCQKPYSFELYHQAIREPLDYYQFGIEILSPLVNRKMSSVLGKEYLPEIKAHLKNQENVVFFANHQTEADPVAISILLEDLSPDLAQEMIFVAGARVITDPLAVPFSLGINLLCVHSKRYIDFPPEEKRMKQLHNQQTMEKMSALLSSGGKAIYVAPSGGRDRPNLQGVFEVAPFDPQSIEMFYLMTQKSKKTTHFYPLSLKTYGLVPPPETIQVELGEMRKAQYAPIHLGLGPRIDMEHIPGNDMKDKHKRRQLRADYIWGLVNQTYSRFP